MPWPSTPGFGTTNTDAGSDSPSLARVDIHNALLDLSSVIAGRGQANGVAPIDAGSKVPTANLPAGVANGVASLDANAKVPVAQLALSAIAKGLQAYSTAGTHSWTVPAGVTKVMVLIAGAGGGGGYGANNGTTDKHGGGGGAGGVIWALLDVLGGDALSISVGAGGAGGLGPANADAAAGGNTAVTVTRASTPIGSLLARGGDGGNGNGTQPEGGDGGGADPVSGAAVIGSALIAGGTGGTGQTQLGGMGGSNFFTGSAPTASGNGYGGGGYGSGTGGPASGFTGKDGGAIILW